MASWLRVLVLIISIGLISIAVLFYKMNTAFNAPLNLLSTKEMSVEKGQYAHFLINRLSEQKIIEQPLLIKMALKLEPELANVKLGTYDIKFGMSARSLFKMLSEGKVKTFSITLIEGLTWKNWLSQLNKNSHLIPSSKSPQDWLNLFAGKIEGESLEGWLLADTYQFTRGSRVEDIALRANEDMLKYLNEAWHLRALDLPYQSPYEALIMASIIEKETGVAHERPRIASVFVNRLRKNMRLQTDPTVIYGMGDSFDGNIRRKDLRQPTAYNTYVIKGLPPTPIAMPGRLSIEAALNPLDTEDFYFVSKGDGTHYFSQTLEQHNRAVREYQLKKKSN